MARPTDGILHEQLRRDVEAFCQSLGFLSGEMTYHDQRNGAISTATRQRLQIVNTLSALVIRNNNDAFFVHQKSDAVFECEFKARNSVLKVDKFTGREYWERMDALIEASQFILNMFKTSAGGQVLYCFRNPDIKLDIGFWCSKQVHDTIKQIQWPPRWEKSHPLRQMVEAVFPNADILPVNYTNGGSDDPYLVVPYSFLSHCRSWRTEIAAATEQKNDEWTPELHDWVASHDKWLKENPDPLRSR